MAGLTQYLNGVDSFHSSANPSAAVAPASLAGKTVFFYFSASWCPPCRGFTPQLAAFYNKYHEEKNFEVIFITWDEEKEDSEEYFKKMPWLAPSFEDTRTKVGEFLTKKFDVQSIPTLIGIDADSGKVITTKARQTVVTDPEGKDFPWPDQ